MIGNCQPSDTTFVVANIFISFIGAGVLGKILILFKSSNAIYSLHINS